ncbi:hypothetical protein D3C80_1506620 [compost metagenome]
MTLCTPEAAEVEQPLRSAVEHNAHPVHQVDDSRRRLTHRLDRRLVRQEVTAVDGIVKMLPGRVALALRIDGSVDAALCADRMRSFDRNERE